MKKVLFLLKVPPPVHGSTLMNQKVMQSELIRQSFDCTYFPLSISSSISDIGRFSFRKLFRTLGSYFTLAKVLKKNKPELVYFALSPYGPAFIKDFFFNLIIRWSGTKIVFHLHGLGIKHQAERSKLFHYLYKCLFRGNDVICLSKELTSDVAAYNKDPFIVPNGIEHLRHNGFPPEPTIPGGYKVAYLSNFIRSKGILDLIAALAVVKQRGNSFSLSLIGKEGDVTRAELEEYLKTLHLDTSVNHIGPLYENDKYRELMSSDLFVFPTHYKNEAQPLVIIEAMQCGLPVVSTMEGAIPSLVDEGVTGFLVENSNNSFKLADKVEYLIRNPDVGKVMGRAAKKKFDSNYTIDIFEKNLAHVLNEILNEYQVK